MQGNGHELKGMRFELRNTSRQGFTSAVFAFQQVGQNALGSRQTMATFILGLLQKSVEQ